eukprot:gene4617-18796_t
MHTQPGCWSDHTYDVFHMNWNPSLFKHQYSTHYCWKQDAGPVKDLYNMGENPQFMVDIKSTGPTVVWILLSRHIVDIQDFAHNKEYITCHIYRGGERIHYPNDPIHMGTKINSPHYLAKINISDRGWCAHRYTVVISQHEKATTLNFTLKALAAMPFKMAKVPSPFQHQKEHRIEGAWSEQTAGGSSNNRASHEKNPKWVFRVEAGRNEPDLKQIPLRVQLFAPKEYSAGITVRCGTSGKSFDSGPYRSVSTQQRHAHTR